MHCTYLHTMYCILYPSTTPAPPTPNNVTAQFINASSVRVAWQWTSSGPASNCFNTTTVTYRPEGGDESSLQLSDPAATETTLTDLQNSTSYTITVVATTGEYRREGVTFLPLQGTQRSRRRGGRGGSCPQTRRAMHAPFLTCPPSSQLAPTPLYCI